MTSSALQPPFAVLYVDDEVKALRYFRESFDDEFVIHTAANAWDGYQLLVEHGPRIGVLITDQRMPGESGVELMEKARQLNPNIARILVTAYAEYQTAVDAVNAGHAFRYLHKPWDPEDLRATISHALRYYEALVERETLLSQKAATLRHMMMADRVSGLAILAEGLNHHLRNALTVIRAFIDLAPLKLAEEIDGGTPRDTSFWRDWQPHALGQVGHIQSILERLSTASENHRLIRSDVVTVADVLSEALHYYTDALIDHGINVSCELETALPPLIVNRDKFRQLWHLLFTQALTDLEPGHDLEIEAVTDSDPSPPWVVIRVRDNAAWPDQQQPGQLFDPFFVRTGKPDEFGVNLMACYVIVHLHGGTIEARRLHPRGIEIEIRLPTEPPATTEPADRFFEKLLGHEERWKLRELPDDPPTKAEPAREDPASDTRSWAFAR
ncbi:MAG: hybrid sensor histidine kinase/response regulator [Verrucomicrobiales bacterium]|nr:hybrid sensor histidine kinase/response regulator [Verrucomicrobiales bacterium]